MQKVAFNLRDKLSESQKLLQLRKDLERKKDTEKKILLKMHKLIRHFV